VKIKVGKFMSITTITTVGTARNQKDYYHYIFIFINLGCHRRETLAILFRVIFKTTMIHSFSPDFICYGVKKAFNLHVFG